MSADVADKIAEARQLRKNAKKEAEQEILQVLAELERTTGLQVQDIWYTIDADISTSGSVSVVKAKRILDISLEVI